MPHHLIRNSDSVRRRFHRGATRLVEHFEGQNELGRSWQTSWSFTERIRDAGLMPSFESVGDAFDNAMMGSFWWSMQNELLNRKKWKTRLELSNAIFDYIEIFYNRQRRHSSLDYVSPVEFELSFKEEKTA